MIHSKIYLTSLALSLFSTVSALAVPAIKEPIKVTQPDGSTITVRLEGDERGYRVYSLDYLPIVVNKEGYYEYANPKCAYLPAGVRVNDPQTRSMQEKNWIATSGIKTAQAVTVSSPRRLTASAGPYVRISNYPTIGRQKALVVLVEFADRSFSSMDDAYTYYDGMLNQPGFTHDNGANGSVRDFYLDSSNGLFDPEFVVVGPVVLEKSVEHYGLDTDTTLDANAWEMVTEACKAIDDEIDFSDFDADGDGYVDSIYFFYAGFGEADSNIRNVIWPHNGLLKDNWGVDLILDGKIINNYACSNEIRFNTSPLWKPVGIGTFVHEFGHVLGLADHYDTLYASGRTGVEQWDTMAAASYFDNQNTPLSFSAYERAVLGWINPTMINPQQEGILSLNSLASEDGNTLRVEVPETDGLESFFIEYRTRKGWDKFLPAEGILVWHIDEDPQKWATNKVNIDPEHQCVDLVEADGTENSGSYHADPFPGTADVRQFDFIAWNQNPLFSFDYIETVGDQAMIILANTDFVPSTPVAQIKDIHGSSFCITWPSQSDALKFHLSVNNSKGDSIKDYENIEIVSTYEDNSLEVAGLAPLTEYVVTLYAMAGSYSSSIFSTSVSTGELEFFESAPQNVRVSDYSNQEITLEWEKMNEAQDYKVDVYRLQFSSPEEEECDFTDGVNNLPEGWSSSSTRISKSLFGQKSPALQLNEDGDYLEINHPKAQLTTISFFQRSQIADNSLKVETFDKNDNILSVELVSTSGSGSIESINLPEETSRVRISFSRQSGYAIIDDVKVGVSYLDKLPVSGLTDIFSQGAESIKINGSFTDGDYVATVTGKKGNEYSLPSEEVALVKPASAIEIAADLPSKTEYYDLTGRRIKPGEISRGIYIMRQGNKTCKIIK